MGRIEKFHTPSFQTLPSHAKKLNLGLNALNGLHQVGAMKVSRDFSSDQQDLFGFHPLSRPAISFFR
jgi:hypothetical protein